MWQRVLLMLPLLQVTEVSAGRTLITRSAMIMTEPLNRMLDNQTTVPHVASVGAGLESGSGANSESAEGSVPQNFKVSDSIQLKAQINGTGTESAVISEPPDLTASDPINVKAQMIRSLSIPRVSIAIAGIGICVATLTLVEAMLIGPWGTNSMWIKESMLPFICGVRWVLLSAGLIIFNKWLLAERPVGLGFQYPVLLVCWQQAFATLLTKAIQLYSALFSPGTSVCDTAGLTWDDWARRIIPVGMLVSASLSFGNEAVIHLNVPYLQVIKESEPTFVYLLSIVLAWDELHVGKLSAVCFIAVGAIVFTFAEMSVLSFSVTGVVFQCGASFADVARALLLENLMSRSHVKLNPMATFTLIAPVSLVCIAPFVEWSELSVALSQVMHGDILVFLIANALWSAVLNLSLLAFFEHVPASYVAIVGSVKDCAVIFGSAFIFGNSLTNMHAAGLATSITGTWWFLSYKKQQSSSNTSVARHNASGKEREVKRLKSRKERDAKKVQQRTDAIVKALTKTLPKA